MSKDTYVPGLSEAKSLVDDLLGINQEPEKEHVRLVNDEGKTVGHANITKPS